MVTELSGCEKSRNPTWRPNANWIAMPTLVTSIAQSNKTGERKNKFKSELSSWIFCFVCKMFLYAWYFSIRSLGSLRSRAKYTVWNSPFSEIFLRVFPIKTSLRHSIVISSWILFSVWYNILYDLSNCPRLFQKNYAEGIFKLTKNYKNKSFGTVMILNHVELPSVVDRTKGAVPKVSGESHTWEVVTCFSANFFLSGSHVSDLTRCEKILLSSILCTGCQI